MNKIAVYVVVLILSSCKKEEPLVVTPDALHLSIDKVTEIMIHDIFSPPVASRIFAYPNIAAYEIMALENDGYISLQGQISELTAIPRPDAAKPIDHKVAAMVAHMEMSRKLIFSEEKLTPYRDSLYA